MSGGSGRRGCAIALWAPGRFQDSCWLRCGAQAARGAWRECLRAAAGALRRRLVTVFEVSGLGSPSSAGVGSVSFATGTSTVGAAAVWLSVELMAMASFGSGTLKLSCAVDSLSYRQRRSSPRAESNCVKKQHEKQQCGTVTNRSPILYRVNSGLRQATDSLPRNLARQSFGSRSTSSKSRWSGRQFLSHLGARLRMPCAARMNGALVHSVADMRSDVLEPHRRAIGP